MRGSDGSSEETFVSVRQAWGKGKGEEESAGEKEIRNCDAREIIGIEGTQEHCEKIIRNGEAQSCVLTQEGFDGQGRQAHGGA